MAIPHVAVSEKCTILLTAGAREFEPSRRFPAALCLQKNTFGKLFHEAKMGPRIDSAFQLLSIIVTNGLH